jgi:glutamine synthetase
LPLSPTIGLGIKVAVLPYREFLTRGGVFTDDAIDGYIDLKMEEVTRLRMSTHPVEFDMYYSL